MTVRLHGTLGRPALAFLVAANLLIGTQPCQAKTVVARDGPLVTVARSDRMPWNAVALDSRGRIFVSSPRWAGNSGPQVAIVGPHGDLVPYPSAEWNNWESGGNPAHAFVSVNAIHRSTDGDLWIVDTGSPVFGARPVTNGAKIVRIDPRTDAVVRIFRFPGSAIREHTYIDDIRINGKRAYLTDAGEGAILVLDLETGNVQRRFDGRNFTRARPEDRIVVEGRVVRNPDGTPLHVNTDPLELSPDGKYLYFGPLSGPMYRIETRYLDDTTLSDAELARHVSRWFDLPPVGGTAMDDEGNFYYTVLADNSLKRRSSDGTITTIARNARLRWVDAPFLDGAGNIYLPIPQLDGAAVFHHGKSTVHYPFLLFRMKLPATARVGQFAK
jgi:sugar lactone lactonase YvrE